ncbi:MAG: hypothetical protein HND47_17195 [Chloroflexi bacterium]|nr:hypothetical protein [Chloroflexota bacterium]
MRAYAYFFRHKKLTPTIEGQQRLEVIAENTQLGAGYSIAMRDLEIRGAGELLGTRQHGYIQAVGFHLYTRMLADAVRRLRILAKDNLDLDVSFIPPPSSLRLRSGQAFSLPLSIPVNVDLPLAVGIPADYIPDQDLRLRLYRRIADLRDETELDALGSEFRDRFGQLPEMVQNLFFQMRVKLRAEKAGLSSVSWESGQILLRYPAPADGARSEAPARLAERREGWKIPILDHIDKGRSLDGKTAGGASPTQRRIIPTWSLILFSEKFSPRRIHPSGRFVFIGLNCNSGLL